MCLVLLGAVIGNAATATKLQTARTINGTSFNGTANITTVKWGASRNIAISGAVQGNANMDGSGNMNIVTTQANISVLTGTITTTAATGTDTVINTKKIDFPSGFTKDNSVVISIGLYMGTTTGYAFETIDPKDPRTWLRSGIGHMVTYNVNSDNKINLILETPFTESYTYNYKIVLLKVS